MFTYLFMRFNPNQLGSFFDIKLSGGAKGPPSISPEPIKAQIWNIFLWMWYYKRSVEKYQNSNQGNVTFLWRHHTSTRSLKLSILMNKSNYADIIKQVYNTHLYWKCVIPLNNVDSFLLQDNASLFFLRLLSLTKLFFNGFSYVLKYKQSIFLFL